LADFRKVVKEIGLDIRGKIFNLDMGFDSKPNRKIVWNFGMKPNIPENIRNRNKSKPKKGRPRYFDEEIYDGRFSVERTFGWEDSYRRLVIRYDRKSSNYRGKKLLAYSLINLRYFCGKSQ
jgi:transposase